MKKNFILQMIIKSRYVLIVILLIITCGHSHIQGTSDNLLVKIGDYSPNGLIYIYPSATSSSAYTYITNSNIYGGDAAYIEESSDRIKIKINGYVGWVSKSDVKILNKTEITTPSYYSVNDSKELIHSITYNPTEGGYSRLNLGPAPDCLKQGTTYYSYDGNYFYESLQTMKSDYSRNSFANSVNASVPYFNYYQYLPYHSISKYTVQDINEYLKKEGFNAKATSYPCASVQTALFNEGQAFIDSQNYYGTNALLSLSVAINESGWGRSNYAINRNNLFGHNAFDSNPDKASYYPSIKASIDTHNTTYINWGYLDYPDYRYFGGHLGNKASGINVKYASDAYWGEKAAANYYWFDKMMGMKDYNSYSLAIKEIKDSVNIRRDASTSSIIISALNNPTFETINMPVIILDEKKGETIDGESLWYKVQSDHLLNSNGTRQIFDNNQPLNSYNTKYNFNNNYGYINSSLLYKVNKGTDDVVPPPDKPIPPQEIIKGDVNGDGKVSSLDYIKIKNHIMNVKTLSDEEKTRADVNGDGKISSLDYIKIKNHIMGKAQL